MKTENPHILVSLGGTLATQSPVYSADHIGLPVQAMLNRVRAWLSQEKPVMILTSKAATPEGKKLVRDWLDGLGLNDVGITDTITKQTEEIWSSTAVGVLHNKGIPVEAMVAHEFMNLIKAADVPVENGQSYADAGRIAANKVRGAIIKLDTVRAQVDAADNAMGYVDTSSLAKLELTGAAAKAVASLIGDIERAKRAIGKAHKALKA